jgi:hypothetical protein
MGVDSEAVDVPSSLDGDSDDLSTDLRECAS